MNKASHSDLANRLANRMRSKGVIAQPLCCAEIGARKPLTSTDGGEPFYQLADINILAFEADQIEAARLNVGRSDHNRSVMVVNAAVSGTNGEAVLFVTRNPKCSSLYKPNENLIARYPGLSVAALDHTVRVPTVTLASALSTVGWPEVHFLKMDVQGAELDVLKGAGAALNRVVAVVTEVSFQPIYEGQPLAEDVFSELRRNGFEFYRHIQQGGFPRENARRDQMQVLWADVLFLRSPELLVGEDAARLAVFATLYGAFDIAECALQRVSSEDKAWLVREIRRPFHDLITDIRYQARRIRRGVMRRMLAFTRPI